MPGLLPSDGVVLRSRPGSPGDTSGGNRSEDSRCRRTSPENQAKRSFATKLISYEAGRSYHQLCCRRPVKEHCGEASQLDDFSSDAVDEVMIISRHCPSGSAGYGEKRVSWWFCLVDDGRPGLVRGCLAATG